MYQLDFDNREPIVGSVIEHYHFPLEGRIHEYIDIFRKMK